MKGLEESLFRSEWLKEKSLHISLQYLEGKWQFSKVESHQSLMKMNPVAYQRSIYCKLKELVN